MILRVIRMRRNLSVISRQAALRMSPAKTSTLPHLTGEGRDRRHQYLERASLHQQNRAMFSFLRLFDQKCENHRRSIVRASSKMDIHGLLPRLI